MCAQPGLIARRADIKWRLAAAREVNSRVLMVTLIVSSGLYDPLSPTLVLLEKAYRHMFGSGGRGLALKAQLKILGIDKTLEVAYTEDGYHPHFHLLVFLRPGALADVSKVERVLASAWREALKSTARKADMPLALPSRGVVVKTVEDDAIVAHYLTKLPVDSNGPNGMFIALAKMAEHGAGDCRCGECRGWYKRWREYTAVMPDRKRYSAGRVDAELEAAGATPRKDRKRRRRKRGSSDSETRR